MDKIISLEEKRLKKKLGTNYTYTNIHFDLTGPVGCESLKQHAESNHLTDYWDIRTDLTENCYWYIRDIYENPSIYFVENEKVTEVIETDNPKYLEKLKELKSGIVLKSMIRIGELINELERRK